MLCVCVHMVVPVGRMELLDTLCVLAPLCGNGEGDRAEKDLSDSEAFS